MVGYRHNRIAASVARVSEAHPGSLVMVRHVSRVRPLALPGLRDPRRHRIASNGVRPYARCRTFPTCRDGWAGQPRCMVGYRRNRIAGGTYFFTVTLRDRRSDLLVREIEALREAWRVAVTRVPHKVVAAVVLPDHLHAVIRMEDETADYPRLWQDIKKGFTRRTSSRTAGSAWQPRYWERTIGNEIALQACVDYVHINPLKHGLVKAVADWPYSTFHRYVRAGGLPPDWAASPDATGMFGER